MVILYNIQWKEVIRKNFLLDIKKQIRCFRRRNNQNGLTKTKKL